MKSVAAAMQDELLKFLRSPASYPEKPEKVEVRQTHISIVAMTTSLVYKVRSHSIWVFSISPLWRSGGRPAKPRLI